MSSNNFYNVLGVDEKATQAEIKKAYRKLAVEHHPDKGGSEDRFKEISEAYDTLGDETKRAQYDNKRNNPFMNGGGGFNPFEDLFGSQFYQKRKTVPDKIIEVTVGAVESYLGGDKVITYTKNDKCDLCNGGGGDKTTCGSCSGQGFRNQTIGGSMFQQVVRQICNNCKGSGFVYTRTCGGCHGQTTKPVTEVIKIKLPHGIDDGQFLKLQGKGDYHDGFYGNLVIRPKTVPEKNFEKMGDDLIYNQYFTKEELDNSHIEVPHPLGAISITMPNLFDTSKPLRVKGRGYNGVGDMFVKQHVKFTRN
jgi:molecular chaperone DnaJ